VSAPGLVITVAAGVMFGAAYLKTGRLWLAAGSLPISYPG